MLMLIRLPIFLGGRVHARIRGGFCKLRDWAKWDLKKKKKNRDAELNMFIERLKMMGTKAHINIAYSSVTVAT